jgi:hypothetical protein
VSLVQDERVEALLRALVDHFDVMGGIPLLAVFDRPKTIALGWRRDGVVTQWNSTFASVALDLGLGVHCRALTGTHRTLRTSDLSCKCKCLVHALAVKCSYGKADDGADGIPSSPRRYCFSKAIDIRSANPSSCPQVFHRQTDSSRHEVTGPPAVQVACGARDSHRDWCTSLQVRAHGDEVPSRPRNDPRVRCTSDRRAQR